MSIFISYSHDNKQIVEQIANLLELAFPSKYVFWDRRLLGGEDTDNKLHEQVRRCQVFVFFASHSSMSENSYCQREVAWAKEYDKHIVPYIFSVNPEEVVRYLGDGNIFCVEGSGIESFAKLCGSIFQGFTTATYSNAHQRQMLMLYQILDKLDDDYCYESEINVYESGYELEYGWAPVSYPPLNEKKCQEVRDILSMMERLQSDWEKLSDEEKAEIEEKTRGAEYTIMNIGFSDYEETKEWGYLQFLRRRGWFRDLILVGNEYGPLKEGGDTFPNLPQYRGMLDMYKARPDDYDNYGRRRTFTPDDFITVINACLPTE
ncbi:MAG: YfbU family protein [Chloroflexota bacterium]|nr:YfbU family protein [Chloroflexota bacterium]MDE2908322.1 YfbU family protein [Chloroflexota bacterium]